jgi:hypothetical protein
MKKTLISTITTLSFSAFAFTAIADETVKMIMTNNKGSQVIVSEDQLTNQLSGNNITIEEDVIIQSPNTKPKEYNYDSTSVLRQLTKKYSANAYSTKSSGTVKSTYVPNDPYFDEQIHWLSSTIDTKALGYNADHLGYNNILSSVQKLSPMRRPVIGIIDSGFYDHPDIIYRDGYNFSTVSNSVLGEYFLIPEEFNTPEGRQLNCSVHGSGVTAVAAATRDNSIGFAGIVDADILAARSMHCGYGYLSETATSILWQIGEDISDVRPAEVTADVINISLGGISDDCPTFIQSAFDKANKKGVPIVVAIGNSQIEASGFTPVNCKGGINVAAATREGDLHYSSNFGEAIDIVALGQSVVSVTEDPDVIGYWEESSFAAPIVSATITNAVSELGKLTVPELKFFLSATATPFMAGQCDDSLRCGAGILDAAAFIAELRNYKSGKTVTLSPALNNAELCDKTLYATDDNELALLCETYEIILPEHQSNREDIRFEILEFIKGDELLHENGALVASSTSSRMLISSLDMDESDYGVRMCNSERCFGDTAIKISNNSDTLPAMCIE